ncbi:MAG: hypothetical protein AAB348_00750 [Patescibacteria group bacterium]
MTGETGSENENYLAECQKYVGEHYKELKWLYSFDKAGKKGRVVVEIRKELIEDQNLNNALGNKDIVKILAKMMEGESQNEKLAAAEKQKGALENQLQQTALQLGEGILQFANGGLPKDQATRDYLVAAARELIERILNEK